MGTELPGKECATKSEPDTYCHDSVSASLLLLPDRYLIRGRQRVGQPIVAPWPPVSQIVGSSMDCHQCNNELNSIQAEFQLHRAVVKYIVLCGPEASAGIDHRSVSCETTAQRQKWLLLISRIKAC